MDNSPAHVLQADLGQLIHFSAGEVREASISKVANYSIVETYNSCGNLGLEWKQFSEKTKQQ